MVEAPTRIEASNVEGLATDIAREYRADPEGPLAINMARVDAISRPAGAFLSNVLLTDLAEASLDVVAPERSPAKKLTCSGLGFAFAHRAGSTSFKGINEGELELDRWRVPWTPARGQPGFLPKSEPDDPSFAVRAHAAFVNPHSTSRRKHRRDVPYRMQSWLHGVLPPRATGSPGDRFLEDLQNVCYELVDNVAEHAWPRGEREPLSLVQVSVARGSSAQTRDRIWVVVLDTGPGIVKTALPKIDGEKPSAEALFTGLLSGTFLQRNQRARGLGLPRVSRLCGRWKGATLHIRTGHHQVVLSDGRVKVSALDWNVRGTVILARFLTPPERLKQS